MALMKNIPGVPKKSIPKIKVFLQNVMVRDFIKNILSKYFRRSRYDFVKF